MRFDVRMRRQQQKQKLTEGTHPNDDDDSPMMMEDARDDTTTTTTGRHQEQHFDDEKNNATTGTTTSSSSRPVTRIIDIDESKSLFRSTSTKLEYAASSPYYDVLLYSFTPEQEQRQQLERYTSATSKKHKQPSQKSVTTQTKPAGTKTGRINSRNIDTTTNITAINSIANTTISTIREQQLLQRTTINNNNMDPPDNQQLLCGDGDQSPIVYDPYVHQVYLDLFRTGGDFDDHIDKNASTLYANRRDRNHSTNRTASTPTATMTTNQAPLSSFSSFANHCVSGRYDRVQQVLEKHSIRKGKNWNVMIQLLETRETFLRLSPLLLTFCMLRKIGIAMMTNHYNTKTTTDHSWTSSRIHNTPTTTTAKEAWMKYIDQMEQNLIKVVIVLLRYCASPMAKDICGRTICFYGASTYATPRSLAAVTMCCNAAMSAHFVGKEVILHGIDAATTSSGDNGIGNDCYNKDAVCNGMRGLAGGYQAATGRRIVFLFGQTSDITIDPRNLCLASNIDGGESIAVVESMMNLCNVQDRLGHVCIAELICSKRKDVIKYLLDNHSASIDIEDWTGRSIRHRSFEVMTNPISKSSVLLDDEITSGQFIVTHAMKRARHDQKCLDSTCTACCKQIPIGNVADDGPPLQVCQRCMSVRYCSAKCQVDHWTDGGHRTECPRLRKLYKQYITIDELSATTDSIRLEKDISFAKPSYVACDDVFTVKVELLEHPREVGIRLLHIYDKSVECDFDVKVNEKSSATKLMKLLEKVKAESITAGTAIYLAASFDRNGICSIFINRRKVKVW